MKYSFIVPVYNRPDEVDELLASLCEQKVKDFEVLIVEDGSSVDCEEVCGRYRERLDLKYFKKDNSGPGQTRNYGVARAQGEYVIILDSDVVLPPDYLTEVERELAKADTDAFGGPDRAHPDFTSTQKAINYAMTSFFTTGGIRGGKRARLDKFYPRSFNMGVRREVYDALGGFSKMRFGEDIDFSTRIFKGGFRCRLFPEAWVWHKRRTDLRKFFKQVHNSGIARIHLTKRHPGTLKLVHLLPAVFTAGCLLLGMGVLCGLLLMLDSTGETFEVGLTMFLVSLAPLALYALLVLADASIRNRSWRVGLLSVAASFVQLTGYGSGFLRAWWERQVLGHGEFEAFKDNFYE